MTDHTPPTDQQLYAYETAARNAARIGSGIDPAAVLELAAQVRHLRTELAKEQRLHGDTIDDRDRARDAADKLAYAVAPETVIGVHTADNSPWENALDLITPMAEVDRLRQQRSFLIEQLRRKDAASGAGDRALTEFLAAEASVETHVVADDSDDPEHVDDCPGCQPQADDQTATDRAILKAAPESSDDWDDATWAAWWRTAERVHGDRPAVRPAVETGARPA